MFHIRKLAQEVQCKNCRYAVAKDLGNVIAFENVPPKDACADPPKYSAILDATEVCPVPINKYWTF